QKDFGPMKKAEQRTIETGLLHAADAQPLISDDIISEEPAPDVKGNAWNMIVPITIMVLMMPVSLLYTGWDPARFAPEANLGSKIITALGNGSGSTSVLWAVLTSLFVAAIMYRTQKIFTVDEMVALAFKGIGSLMPLAVLMMLAFAIGKMSKDLGTGLYLADLSKQWLHAGLVPFVLFLTASFIAFSTGTSWGTFAIMLAIAVPMAQQFEHTLPLAVAAVLSGGVFGDHCSPISDTTIISSMASACDHIDHVKTQLPYALTAGAFSALLFLLAGFTA
ncbi:MAG: sodium:solute symporter, partial [Calditrichaeota bacterium]